MEIIAVTNKHSLWNEIICFAENCSWRGGHYLAEQMKNNAFHGWERVLAAVEDGETAGFCTLTEKDEIAEKYDFSPFIGSVFVDEKHRGQRLSGMMIEKAVEYAKENGFSSVYVMSGEVGLYEKYGFTLKGHYETIFGGTEQLFVREL